MGSPLTIKSVYPHKCRSRLTHLLQDQYCSLCGICLSSNPLISFLRPFSFSNFNVNVGNPSLVLESMIRKQTVHLHYSPDAFHLLFRPVLIDWLEKTARKLDLCAPTIHLAVAILDIVLSGYAIPEDKMEIMVFTALNMAGKMNDRDERLPCLKDVPAYFNKDIRLSDLESCEKVVFEVLGFNSNIQTPFLFACQFVICGAISTADIAGKCTSLALSEFERLIHVFASASLQHYQMCSFPAIVSGAAIVAAARKALGFSQVWTEHLEQLTKVSWADMQSCLAILEYTASEVYGDEAKARRIEPSPVKRRSAEFMTGTSDKDPAVFAENELSRKELFLSMFCVENGMEEEVEGLKVATFVEEGAKSGQEL